MRDWISRIFLCACAAAFVSTARAADAQRFELLKGIYFYQLGEGRAQVQTNNNYRFTTQVYANLVGDVVTAAVTTPNGSRVDLLPDADGDPFRYRDRFDPDDRLAFEAFYPNGTYSLFIRGLRDGDRTMTFSITGDQYPAPPILNNYNAAQNLPYNQYNEVSWQPFAGGTKADFIQFQIEDLNNNTVWETPDFGEDGALNGLDTKTIIPARVLGPSSVYFATIRFVKVLGSGSRTYPGVPGTAGYFTRTEFTLRSVSTPPLDTVIDRVQIWRRVRYGQSTGDGELQPEAERYEFVARLDAIDTNQVASVGLGIPGTPTNSFLLSDPNGNEFELSREHETTQDSFLGLYPNGRYTFDVARVDGKGERVLVDLPGGLFAPVPRIHNVTNYEAYPGRTSLLVSWDPWTNAGPDDFIRVELSDEGTKTWDTANFNSAKHLKPDTTFVIIPGEFLVPGHDYRLRVHFYHVTVSGTRISPGAFVFGGFDSQTTVDFSTQLPDVRTFELAEGQFVWQRGTGPNDFEGDPAGRFRLEAAAAGATTSALLSAQVKTPAGATLNLARDPQDSVFRTAVVEPSAEALAQHYPTGIYEFHFGTANDGFRTSIVNLASTELPPVPQMRNFSSLTQIKYDAATPITWEPWVGTDTNTDRILLTIYNMNGTPRVATQELSASTNRYVIGDKKLADKAVYVARLRFERSEGFENATYPGARGRATIFSETAFYVATVPVMRLDRFPTFIPPDQMSFTIANLLPTRTYAVSVSSDFRTWTRLKTVTINSTAATTQVFTNNFAGERGFFRWELIP
jgi:hypothetical protein